jgi:hypothetical protein
VVLFMVFRLGEYGSLYDNPIYTGMLTRGLSMYVAGAWLVDLTEPYPILPMGNSIYRRTLDIRDNLKF